MTTSVSCTYESLVQLAHGKTPFAQRVQEAIEIIEQALDTYSSPDNIALSFNGGKDCTVLLEITTAILFHHYPDAAPLAVAYVTEPDTFPELEAFVDSTAQRHRLDIVRTPGPLKAGLHEFMRRKPQIQAIIVGTRRSDPHGATMPTFAPTDGDWPRFVRVNPILAWTYNDIWCLLRTLQVPYCSLYDQGYTSLGDRRTTVPNPILASPKSPGGFEPAWTLTDCSSERHGRNPAGKS
ncbi:FAD1 flavin adenine dinucleotide synthetase [Tieghemiomyces parasiticus]|uniref:FAD synthase n=1 Tax=Tieghemiomyces parasiticus TaxID=78921 RepID=A0A9W8A372_9FUNG|nr:FAD1 flavin adenine dinucleotide synthetase [Tieghemiomyces parasiticus]